MNVSEVLLDTGGHGALEFLERPRKILLAERRIPILFEQLLGSLVGALDSVLVGLGLGRQKARIRKWFREIPGPNNVYLVVDAAKLGIL